MAWTLPGDGSGVSDCRQFTDSRNKGSAAPGINPRASRELCTRALSYQADMRRYSNPESSCPDLIRALAGTKFLLPPAVSQKPREAPTPCLVVPGDVDGRDMCGWPPA